MADKLGGFGETIDVEEILKICDEVKIPAEKMTGMDYTEFRAVKFRVQIVAGHNFLIKVHVGGVNYLHLLVFQALPCHGGGIELRGVQKHKKDDPLEPFSC